MKTTKSLFPWFFGAPRPEKEITQPQTQTINSMEQHQTQHQTNRKTSNPTPRLRLFSPLTNEDGSVKMPMLATLALAAFLAIGGLILAATCDFDYSDSFCHSPAPPKTIRLNCYYSGHTGHAQLCCRAANAYHCVIRFTNLIETETRGQCELRCTTGSKFDDCQNDTIFDRCVWERAKYVYPASWQIGCIPIKKMVKKRGPLNCIITGNYCTPDDSTASNSTGDDPSADPSDN